MRQLIAGNWKMNCTRAEALALAAGVRDRAGGLPADLLVCPPSTALAEVAALLAGSPVSVGAQDCSPFPPGAHTGDLSAPMIADAGAAFVILGHSERRTDHDEQSPTVREKVQAAVAAGLTPIVCVGETHDQRQAGLDTETVGYQLFGSLPKPFTGILAYEPVWAIGTGHTPTPDEISIMHGFIRAEMLREFGAAGQTVPILYGGSVKPANAAEILALPDVGGALVGGASLKAEDFLAIARAAA